MPKIKRFLVFKQWPCAESGGWDDLFGDFDLLAEVQKAVLQEQRGEFSWRAQVIDLETGQELEDPTMHKDLLEGGN